MAHLMRRSSFYMAPEVLKHHIDKVRFNMNDMWNWFNGKVNSKREVKRYQFDPKNIKLSNINRANGQSNSLYYGAKKYYAFYSIRQHESEKSIHWRDFNKRFTNWNRMLTACRMECNRRGYSKEETKSRLRKIMGQRPYYDDNTFEFKNRWGKKVDVTDAFDVSVYPNLDVVINMIKRDWPDAQFAGVVVKFNESGKVVKN